MNLSLRSPVLATVIYYDCFNFPLTLIEVHKYLINPARISRIEKGLGEIRPGRILEELDRLVAAKIIGEKNGFYFLPGRDDLYDLRIGQDKISSAKWKKFLRMTRFLALAPYLRGVFASGSMATGNTSVKSDFDILIIAKPGRLYTCRFFLWVISSVIRARRKRHEKVAPDKLCFNHYITADALHLYHESLFNAQTYINLKPAMIEPVLIDKFFAANYWLSNYAYNFRVQKDFTRRSTNPPVALRLIAKACEAVLNSPAGDVLEKYLKKFQQKRIKENPMTYESGGRIVFNDKEMEFHPHSFEKVVLARYKENLRRFGIISLTDERDSGLA